MKTTSLKYISILGLILFLIACSTKKNTWLSRNSNALSTEYNILYNGELALDKGINDLKLQYKDNFWEILPIERMQVAAETALPGEREKKANANFETAELKANKAIQKHSMNIEGSEKNPQMDEAHLLLGKARYYDQRFVPALEAFNYVLYKYPESDKIYEVKIWREKTNVRMDNDALAVNNLRKLLSEIKFKDQIFADANAILSQAFLNLQEKDSAIARLKLAKEFTKQNEEKARYEFILGQLYQDMGQKDNAEVAFRSVIAMNRKAPRQYIVHSYVRLARMFDYQSGDADAFVKKYNELVADRENRPFLDAIYHVMAVFYYNINDEPLALEFYQASLSARTDDQYLVASNYRNIAELYFNKAKYVVAGKYYDSTLVQLSPRSREYFSIKKKRENLDDVIKYEGIAATNDSIIKVYSLSDADRIAYFENYIDTLKTRDQARIELEAKQAIIQNNKTLAGGNEQSEKTEKEQENPSDNNQTAKPGGGSNFYFYNPTTVAYGKVEFAKRWGKRELKDNWRLSAIPVTQVQEAENAEPKLIYSSEKSKIEEAYSTDYYINQLPKTQTEIDSIVKERNFAYYQLGIIYKEKFKEYELAAYDFEQLLSFRPEERLVLPSLYNLYKIYLIIDQNKAEAIKAEIIGQYPDSRYAQILSNSNTNNEVLIDVPDKNYQQLYQLYQQGDYKTVLINVDAAIEQYTGEELVPKFELLKANAIGKLKGLEEYKKALNYVALNYPNSEEGKMAETTLTNDIPKLEKLKFYDVKPLSWKILYRADLLEDKNTKILLDKLNKFIKDRNSSKLTLSVDIYTMNENFIVIHGMKSEDNAKEIVTVLKEYKDYMVPNTAYIISNDNYKIVQIKKNFAEYLTTPPTEPIPVVIPPVKVQEKTPKPAPNSAPVSPKKAKEIMEGEDPVNEMMPPQMPNQSENQPKSEPSTPRK